MKQQLYIEMTEKTTEGGKEVPNPEAAKERSRRSGMIKGLLMLLNIHQTNR